MDSTLAERFVDVDDIVALSIPFHGFSEERQGEGGPGGRAVPFNSISWIPARLHHESYEANPLVVFQFHFMDSGSTWSIIRGIEIAFNSISWIRPPPLTPPPRSRGGFQFHFMDSLVGLARAEEYSRALSIPFHGFAAPSS